MGSLRSEPPPRPIQGAPPQPKPSKPWWRSGRIGQASASTNFHNANAVHTMLGYGDNGDMPKWYAGAIKDGGDANTVAEVADFMNQLHRRDPARAERFNQQVREMLGPEGRAKVMQVAGMAEGSDGVQLAEGKQPWLGGADPNTGHIPIPKPGQGKPGAEELPPGLTEEQIRRMMGKSGLTREEAIAEYQKRLDYLKQQQLQQWRRGLGK